MKVAIIGASGLLGRAVFSEFKQQQFFELIGTGYHRADDQYQKLDLYDKNAIHQFMVEQKPDFIILTAAERRPAICDQYPERTKKINIDAPKIIAEAAKKIGAWVIYISTDYVFDGTSPPYKPEDKPNPINDYGKSKLEGEKAIHQIMNDACILRLPILYGQTEYLNESAVTEIADNLLNSEMTDIFLDDVAIRYPTHTADVSKICFKLIEHKIKYSDFKGVFHYSSEEAYTKYQMGLIMAEILNISHKNIFPEKKENLCIKRPYNCQLDSSALKKIVLNKKTSFREGMSALLLK